MKTSLSTYRFRAWKRFFCLPILFALAVPAYSANVTWTNSTNNSRWEDPLNWDAVFQPGDTRVFSDIAAGTVLIPNTGVTLTESVAVASWQNYFFQGGALSGLGGINKTNGGRLTLVDANTYSGATTLGDPTAGAIGGTLVLAHPKAAQNSDIQAYGSVVEVRQAGTVVKSLALRDLTVGATTAASRLNVYVDATNVTTAGLQAGSFGFDPNSRIDINVSGFSGTPMTYWILSGNGAGNINPENVDVNVNASARVRRTLTRNSDSLYLALTMSSFGAMYSNWMTENGWRVTQVIDYASSKGIQTSLFTALDSLPGIGAIVGPALNQLHAEAYVTEIAYAAQLQRDFNTRLMNWRNMVANNGYFGYENYGNVYGTVDYRGNGSRRVRRYDLWATASAESMKRGRINDYSGYRGDSCGLAVGVEWKLSPCRYGGIAFGYDDASLDYKDLNAENSLRAARISLYGGYVNSCWYSSGFIGYSKDWHDTTRRIRVPGYETAEVYAPGFTADARGRYNDNVLATGFEMGKFYSCYDLNLIPTIGVDYIYVNSPGFRETNGDSANLVVGKASYNSLRTPVGLRTNMDLCIIDCLVLTPEMRLFGVTEWADRGVRRSAYFADAVQAGRFVSEGGSWGRNGFLFGLGLTAQCGRRVTVGFNYDCESWRRHNRHIGSAFLNYRW